MNQNIVDAPVSKRRSFMESSPTIIILDIEDFRQVVKEAWIFSHHALVMVYQ
jgi:hypothetical protein